jgi:hypothetical protein
VAKLYAKNDDLLIHLTEKDIFKLIVVQVEGGGVNYYGEYDLIHGNNIAIPKELAMKVLDSIKEGRICDVYHTFNKDNSLNF